MNPLLLFTIIAVHQDSRQAYCSLRIYVDLKVSERFSFRQIPEAYLANLAFRTSEIQESNRHQLSPFCVWHHLVAALEGCQTQILRLVPIVA